MERRDYADTADKPRYKNENLRDQSSIVLT